MAASVYSFCILFCFRSEFIGMSPLYTVNVAGKAPFQLTITTYWDA